MVSPNSVNANVDCAGGHDVFVGMCHGTVFRSSLN